VSADATRAEIVREARKMFVRDGFAAAGLVEIARAANATTGAIYHHFKDKKGLFRAVAEDVERELMERVGAIALKESDPWAQLRAGAIASLELSTEPDIARIIFHEAPSVIGAAEWREIERRYAFGLTVQLLEALKASGASRIRDAELAASMLLGALIEAATTISLAKEKKAALSNARATMLHFIDALKT
jgi:AcrR family transcriptional regulator